MKRLLIVAAAAVAMLGLATPVGAGGSPVLGAELNGANEVPGPGDKDGKGAALVFLDAKAGEVCFIIEASGIAPALAAHIHVGGADVAGGVVVNLNVAREGLKGCVGDVDSALINAIAAIPGGIT